MTLNELVSFACCALTPFFSLHVYLRDQNIRLYIYIYRERERERERKRERKKVTVDVLRRLALLAIIECYTTSLYIAIYI